MAGGPSSPAKRSFLDLFNPTPSVVPILLKEPSSFRGEPALKYSNAEIESLAGPLKFALVGKFRRGRPSMESLRKCFSKIDLKGSIKLGLLDKRHILIRADNEEDFLRFRLRKFWSFDGFGMRVFKWTPDFRADIESPLVPVWVSFESLPLFMFNKASLFSLARIIGVPLKIDAATSDLTRPSVARVCVEIDLRKDMPKRLWLEIGSVGFWQSIHYEDLPKYCFDCSKIGHLAAECGQPKAAAQAVGVAVASSLPKQKWILKTQPFHPQAENIVPSSDLKFVCASNAVGQVATSPVDPSTAALPVLDAAAAVLDVALANSAAAVPGVVNSATAVDVAVANSATTELTAAENSAAILSVESPAAAAMVDLTAISPQPEAAKTSSQSAAAPASETVCSQQPMLPVQTAVATVGDVDEEHILDESILNPAVQLPTSAVDDLSGSSLSAGVLDVASARMAKECVVSEKTYADVLLGPTQAAGKSYADLNPNAPLFVPKMRFPGTSSSDSIQPRFHAIKSAEFPSLPLPNFRIFFSARPQFPQDSLEEPSSPRPSDIFQMYSEGDDVPRLPIQRKKLSVSLRASSQDFNAKLRKGRRPEFNSFNRRKWKKLAPYSLTAQTSTSNTSSNNAPDSQEHPTAHPNEVIPGNDSLVEYESNWHSSTSDDEESLNSENLLDFDEEYLPMDYHDFSFAVPLQSRRKYNKRFRDLPPRSLPVALGIFKFISVSFACLLA